MKPILMLALAAAVGATVWVSSQDDGSVEPVKGEARKSASRAGSARQSDADQGDAGTTASSDRSRPAGQSRGRVGAASGEEAKGDQMAWEHEALMDGVRRWQARQLGEAFSAKGASAWASMQPPPPPVKVAQAPPPPPPPVAPPFPHKWIGRFNDETSADPSPPAASASGTAFGVHPAPQRTKPIERAIVVSQTSTWVLKQGDVIEGQWRVDQIEARTMRLTYLPLNLPQTVAMNNGS